MWPAQCHATNGAANPNFKIVDAIYAAIRPPSTEYLTVRASCSSFAPDTVAISVETIGITGQHQDRTIEV